MCLSRIKIFQLHARACVCPLQMVVSMLPRGRVERFNSFSPNLENLIFAAANNRLAIRTPIDHIDFI